MPATSPKYVPVERRTVSEEIRQQLQRSILDGTLLPGARLASERELCEQFAVARTSVREAIQGLITLGLVERRGNRTFVAEELPGVIPSNGDRRKLRVQELFEVRRLIEVPMVELAAARATEADRDEICSIASKFVADMPLAEFRLLDRAFHWALARASHNGLLVEVYGKVLDALFESDEFASMLESQHKAHVVRELVATSGQEHTRIAAALGDPDAAAVAVAEVKSHLYRVEQQLVSALL